MKCRLCGCDIYEPFLSLGNSPLANSFITKENLYKKEEYYPLNVYLCENCKLVQVEDFVSSNEIFTPDYAYFSSFSEIWNNHCKLYVDTIVKKLDLYENSRILEIGSNDGTLLQYFLKYNIKPLGVDPAKDAAKEASKKGVETHQFFFNKHYARDVIGVPVMDLIIGNNVLAHNPNLNEFVKAMKYILKPNGVITLEFPYLLNLIKHGQFDTIYHEHFSYFSLSTVRKLMIYNELEIYDVEEISTHGGSLRIYVKHLDDKLKKVTKNVTRILYDESYYGLNDINKYYEFSNKTINSKKIILKFVLSLSKKEFLEPKKKIICYGAPAKGNTLLNYCGLGKEFIDYVVDMNPIKQGKYLPGTHIPIYSIDKIKEDKPDYIIILPWNIKDEIRKILEFTKEWNCKLVTLIPEVEIIN